MPHYVIRPKKNATDEPVLKTRVVEAKNQAQALAFVVEDTLEVALAAPADFMALAKAGHEIEKA